MIVPILFPIAHYPQYVKKIELEDYLKKLSKTVKLMVSCATMGLIGVTLIMLVIVLPKLMSLYSDLGQNIPAYSTILPIVSIILGFALIIYVNLNNSLKINVVENLRKSQDELVTINQNPVKKKIMIYFFLYAVINISAIVISIIYPIYHATSLVYK